MVDLNHPAVENPEMFKCRRNFLKGCAALAAAGFLLSGPTAEAAFQVNIPAPGVRPAATGGGGTTAPTSNITADLLPFGGSSAADINIVNGTDFNLTSEYGSLNYGTADASHVPAGVYVNRLQQGDFTMTFQVTSWSALSSGYLGLGYADTNGNFVAGIEEIASYSTTSGGNPFVRYWDPYTNGVGIPADQPVTYTLSRKGDQLSASIVCGSVTSTVQSITVSGPIYPAIYFFHWNYSNQDTKPITGLTLN